MWLKPKQNLGCENIWAKYIFSVTILAELMSLIRQSQILLNSINTSTVKNNLKKGVQVGSRNKSQIWFESFTNKNKTCLLWMCHRPHTKLMYIKNSTRRNDLNNFKLTCSLRLEENNSGELWICAPWCHVL